MYMWSRLCTPSSFCKVQYYKGGSFVLRRADIGDRMCQYSPSPTNSVNLAHDSIGKHVDRREFLIAAPFQ